MTKSNDELIEAYDQSDAKVSEAATNLSAEAKRLGVTAKDADQSAFKMAVRARDDAESAILDNLRRSGMRGSLLKRAFAALISGRSSAAGRYFRLARGIRGD
ncbi:MAG: hypothetical protein AAGB18_06215 [Pseudomonadota bacterium]